ncbi:hypothetical protein [Kineococcus sp. NPDC059986]|uniref:hypothetical protein n=1 Tax=Kineococcus sp. NPDC059986 TaxID=3155538 RepID=UPI00344E4D99
MTVFDDRTRAIITRSGTMRPQDVADGIFVALAHLVASGNAPEDQAQKVANDLRVARDAFTDNIAAEEAGLPIDIESCQHSHERLAEEIEDAADYVSGCSPVGWTYGANENDPAEAGFYPIDSDGYPIEL